MLCAKLYQEQKGTTVALYEQPVLPSHAVRGLGAAKVIHHLLRSSSERLLGRNQV